MSYPCSMIKDLLPLFQDGVCSEESSRAVEEHLKECGECSRYHAMLRNDCTFAKTQKSSEEEVRMAESLKKVRKKWNIRQKRILAGGVAAVLMVTAVYQILFVVPLKTLSPEEFSVSASVYSVEKLAEQAQKEPSGDIHVYVDDSEEDVVDISMGETVSGEVFSVAIPELPGQEITITGAVKEQNPNVSVITWSSPYLLRNIEYAQPQDGDEKTLYVSAVKTTFLNNKEEEHSGKRISLEFKEIERIMLVDEDGNQQILWQK